MTSRRGFMGVMAIAPVGAAVLGELFLQSDDRALLRALADAVLPSELGSAGLQRTTDQFERWIDRYHANAEVNHGYGTGSIRRLPADPWPNWRTQLQALDTLALREQRTSFAALSVAQRRDLVRGTLEALNADRLPTPVNAPHVALALLGWFYNTSEANDLCYRAAIGSETCRPLGEAVTAPKARS
ncbi:MAG TPA: gluconate 2-dehydrogenase subunit 3 family protein [Longimicrobiales bacterium]|nr:gluconate 2-dehydrogenase subunit 3 family protein [Longimicrobiales bacterium]